MFLFGLVCTTRKAQLKFTGLTALRSWAINSATNWGNEEDNPVLYMKQTLSMCLLLGNGAIHLRLICYSLHNSIKRVIALSRSGEE